MEKVSEDLLIIDKLVEQARIAQQKYESNGSQKNLIQLLKQWHGL